MKQLSIRLKLLMRARIVPGECWPWLASLDNKGYGKISVNNKQVGAYRAAYESFVGPVPQGLELDHLCRNRRCINPSHLEPVTHQENCRRGFGSVTHCWRGHPFDDANTYLYGGKRCCKACNRLSVMAYQKRRGPKTKRGGRQS